MFIAKNEPFDKSGDNVGKQLALPLAGLDDGVPELHFL